MWAAVLVCGLIAATDPMRIGITVLLIARPRPILNLFAFWLGSMASSVGAALVALFLLRDYVAPVVQAVTSVFTSPIVPPIQIVLGVLALPAAVIIAVRSVRQVVPVGVPGGDPSALLSPPKAPVVFSRMTVSWRSILEERGSLGVAFIAGAFSSMPPLEYWPAIMFIAASGAAAGAQISAVVLFTLVAFVIVEIPLVGYLASPVKTQTAVLALHDWVRAHRGPIFAFILGAFGVLMVTTGMRNI